MYLRLEVYKFVLSLIDFEWLLLWNIGNYRQDRIGLKSLSPLGLTVEMSLYIGN